MPSPRRRFITGRELLDALARMSRSDATVKWLVGGGAHHIPAAQAVCIAKASTYEGKYHKGRVYFIREVVTVAVSAFDEEYRRDRAILRWDKPVDRRTTSLWDRILGNPNASAAYSNVVPPGTAARASF
jgi:hypothetical protein